MTKKFFRSLAIGIAVFAFSVLIMYLTYFFTIDYVTRRQMDAVMPVDDTAAAAQEAAAESQPLEDSQVQDFDHYLARLEGNTVKIYICGSAGESFLYNLNVYVNDIPQQDQEALRRGVILKNKQELTSFEEDYNS